MARDPGWGKALRRGVLLSFIPVAWAFSMRRSRDVEGLTSLRSLFIGFGMAQVLFLVVLHFIQPWFSAAAPTSMLSLLFVLCLLSLAGFFWGWRRPIEGDTEAEAAGSYRSVFFLQTAFAQSAALFGFTFSFIIGTNWPYLVGLGFSAIAFAMLAPTQRELERRQRQLRARGSSVSLVDALT